MKRMKKLASIVLAVVMVFAMAIPAMAEDINYVITVKNDNKAVSINGKTYSAYRLFNATYSADGAHVAYTVDPKNCLDVKYTPDAEELSGESLIKWLEANKDNADAVRAFADYVYETYIMGKAVVEPQAAVKSAVATGETAEINVGSAGYYLVFGTANGIDPNAHTGDVTAAVSLTTAKPTAEINPKLDAPQVEKKVSENTKYNQDGRYGQSYNDVADYNMGDKVPFAFYSSVPDMTGYETYKYIFHDVMSAGLTFDLESDVTVTIGEQKLVKDTDFKVQKGTEAGCTFEVVIEDLKAVVDKYDLAADMKIRVDFEATLNQNAEVGLPGNPNKVRLEYSNNPYEKGSTTETPEDQVIVFTYGVEVTKIDGDRQDVTLEGAEFKLHNEAGKWAIIENGKITGWAEDEQGGSVMTSDSTGKFGVAGLDDGKYWLKETKAPDGYNLAKEEFPFEVAADTENGQTWTGVDTDALKNLNDGKAWKGKIDTGLVAGTIENNAGVELPETGGIGTTIFYVVGTILVVGAVVLLVTKKRMSHEQ